MKRIGTGRIIGLLVLTAIMLLICTGAVAERYELAIVPDKTSVNGGERISFTYYVIGNGTPDRITLDAAYCYRAGGIENWAVLYEANAFAKSGTFTMTVPENATAVYAYMTVKDGYDESDYCTSSIPVSPVQKEIPPLKITVTCNPTEPVAGDEVEVTWSVTGGTGKGCTVISPEWCFYDAFGDSSYSSAPDYYYGAVGSFRTRVPDWATRGTFSLWAIDEGDPDGTGRNRSFTKTVIRKTRIRTQPTDRSVIEGNNAVFTVQASGDGLKYQWQYRSSAAGTWSNSPATGSRTATLLVPGTMSRNGYQYRCVITDQNGESVISSVAKLTVQTELKILKQPENVTAEAGEKAYFAVTADGDGLKYLWQYRTSASGAWVSATQSSATAAALTVSVTEAKDGYQYRCIVTDQYGNTALSSTAVLSLPTELKILVHPAKTTVATGMNAKFAVTAAGDGLTYQWQYRTTSAGTWMDAAASGAKTHVLTVPGTASRDGYEYRCTVTDRYGNSAVSNSAELFVLMDLTIDEQPAGKTADPGTTAQFTVRATGNNLTYQWQYRIPGGSWKASPAAGTNTATLNVAVSSTKNGYQYRCVVTDRSGRKLTSSAATLTVRTALKVTSSPAGQTVAAGNNAKFTVTAVGDGLTWQWQYRASSSGGWTASPATGAKTATLTVPGTMLRNGYQYRCLVTDRYGRHAVSSAATLKVHPAVKITAQPAGRNAAAGSSVKFSVKATGDGLTWQWQYRIPGGSWKASPASGANTATVTVTVNAAKDGYQYRCVVTDQYGEKATSSAATLNVQ